MSPRRWRREYMPWQYWAAGAAFVTFCLVMTVLNGGEADLSWSLVLVRSPLVLWLLYFVLMAGRSYERTHAASSPSPEAPNNRSAIHR